MAKLLMVGHSFLSYTALSADVTSPFLTVVSGGDR